MANPYEPEELSKESDSEDNILNRLKRIAPSSSQPTGQKNPNKLYSNVDEYLNDTGDAPSRSLHMHGGFLGAAELPSDAVSPASYEPDIHRGVDVDALLRFQRPQRAVRPGEDESDSGKSIVPQKRSEPASESATKTPAMEGAGGDEPSVLPGYGLPYLVSRMTEEMRTARTGGPRDYSAAQHILNLRAQSEQAPILAEQRRRAEEDRVTKQKLDAARLLVEQKRAETMGRARELSPEEARYKQAQTALIEDKAKHAGEEREAKRSQFADRTARQLQGEAKDLSKRLEKYAGLYSSLVDFNREYPGITVGDESGEIPELTLADKIKAKTGWTSGLPEEKQKLVAMAKDFEDKVIRARTGATINNEETSTYDAILGMGLFSSPEQLARGIKMFADEAKTKINTAYRGASPAAQQIYESGADPDYVVLRNSPVFVSQTPKSQRQIGQSVKEPVASRVSGRDEFPPYPASIKQGQAVLVREKGALPHEAQWIEKSALKGLFAEDDDLEFVRPQDEIEFSQSAQ